jgi:hypothetical protein
MKSKRCLRKTFKQALQVSPTVHSNAIVHDGVTMTMMAMIVMMMMKIKVLLTFIMMTATMIAVITFLVRAIT